MFLAITYLPTNTFAWEHFRFLDYSGKLKYINILNAKLGNKKKKTKKMTTFIDYIHRSEHCNIHFNNVWYLFCFTWTKSSGDVRYFTNDQERASKTSLTGNVPIPGGGKLYVGLSQGSYGGGFDGAKAFKGTWSTLTCGTGCSLIVK